MSRKRWRAELPRLCPLCPHIIVCHFSEGSAAGSSGRRELRLLILSSWEVRPAARHPGGGYSYSGCRAANNIRKHGHRQKFK